MIDLFNRTRARLQRTRDAKFFSGWVVKISDVLLEVQVSGSVAFVSGDRFSVEIVGKDKSILFDTEFRGQQGAVVALAICRASKPMPNAEPFRVRKNGVTARVSHLNKVLETTVVDVSEAGLGISCLEAIPKGIDLSMLVSSGDTQIAVSGHTKYCRPETQPGRFRIGIALNPMDGNSAREWMNFVND